MYLSYWVVWNLTQVTNCITGCQYPCEGLIRGPDYLLYIALTMRQPLLHEIFVTVSPRVALGWFPTVL